MRRIVVVSLCLTLCVLATPLSAQPQAQMPPKQGQKLALLVGVKDYHHPNLAKLRFSENDVTAMAEILRKAGYQVVVLCGSTGKTDPKLVPTKANIENQLALLLGQCKDRQDTVLLAFAGHGMQFDGQKDAYFCPCDAAPFADKTATLVSMSKVYHELERCFAGVKVLLVDACRNDPKLGRGARSGIDGDTAPRPPRGVAVLFSCAAGEVAYEHEKFKHGVFFHFVLEGLRGEAKKNDGQVTFHSLADYVAERVANTVPNLVADGAQQSPNMKADLIGASPVLLAARAAPAKVQPLAHSLVLVQNKAQIASELDLSRDQTLPGNKAYKEFTFQAEAGKTYQIDLACQGFKPYLYLQDDVNKTVMENDNSAGAAASQIVCKTEKTGTYRIVATCQKGGTGKFMLTVARIEVAPVKVQQLVIKTQPGQLAGKLGAKDPVDAQGKHFKAFTFQAEAGKPYLFEMAGGTGLDPLVRIEDAAGKVVKEEDFGDGKLLLSRLIFTPAQTGTYRAITAAFKAGITGDFVLTTVRLEIRAAKVLPLNLVNGQATVESTLGSQDGLDAQGKYHKVYAFKAEAGKPLRIEMTGHNGLDPIVRVTNESGQTVQDEQFADAGKLSRLVFRAPQAGTYRIVATTFKAMALGTFTLRVAPDAGDVAGPAGGPFTLANGLASLNATINAQDPTDAANRHFKAFPFKGEAGKIYRFEVTGKNGFDPLVRVETTTGQLLKDEDVGDSAKQLSRVFFTPEQTGTFRVVACAFKAGATGECQLVAVRVEGADAKIVPFAISNGLSSLTSTITDNDPRDGDGKYFRAFPFKAEAGKTYRFEMTGKEGLDPYVRIETAQGKLVQNEDSGDGKASRVFFKPAQTGTFRVIATTFKPNTVGKFGLSATVENNSLPNAAVAVGGGVPFKLANGQSRVEGVLTEDDSVDNANKFFLGYAFKAEAGKTYRFEMVGKNGLDPALRVETVNGQILKQEDFGDGKVSRLAFTPSEAGTYIIITTTYKAGAIGSYTLSATQDTGPMLKGPAPKSGPADGN